ncbi:hypothetical protein CHS0354_020887, partial [Potamilus streckersoni]
MPSMMEITLRSPQTTPIQKRVKARLGFNHLAWYSEQLFEAYRVRNKFIELIHEAGVLLDNIVKLIVYYGRNDNSLDKGGVEPVEDHPGANRFSMIHVGLASSKQPAYKCIRPIMIAPLLYVRRVPGNEYDVFFMWRQKSDDLL